MKKSLFIIALSLFLLGFTSILKAQEIPLYEYYNTIQHKHFYTTNYSELGAGGHNGWILYGTMGYLHPAGTVDQIYRFYQPSSGAHYYTLNKNVYPGGFQLEGVQADQPPIVELRAPVYEFFNHGSGDYYYATDPTPPSGYVLNGISFYIIVG